MHMSSGKGLHKPTLAHDKSWSTPVNHDQSQPPPGTDDTSERDYLNLTPLANAMRRRGFSYRRILEDTVDLLALLRYAAPEDEAAAKAQIVAIRDLLGD
jgi:hypothetical protein